MTESTLPSTPHRHRLLLLGAVGLFVFSSRLWLIQVWGSPLPFWDQWQAEGLNLYAAWERGTFQWSQLFTPHNEHRIALTRLASLGLYLVGDGWHPWNQLLLNALLHAGTAVLLVWALFRGAASALLPLGALTIAAVFALPAGWQNALWGFQSQVYFSGLLAVAAMVGLIHHSPDRAFWWAGLVAGGLAVFGNAGGALALPAAAVGYALRLSVETGRRSTVQEQQLSSRPLLWGGLIVILVAAGLISLLRVEVPGHAYLRAKSIGQFVTVFGHSLAWPGMQHPALALVIQAPLVLWLLHAWRNHQISRSDAIATALVAWAVLQAAAIAYSRGAGLPESRPLSRYHDPLLLGMAGQCYAMLRLAVSNLRGGRAIALLWAGVVAVGALQLTTTNLSLHLPYKRLQDDAGYAAIQAYLLSGDLSGWAYPPLPHPDPRVLKQLLDDPALRAVWPQELTAPSLRPWPIAYGRSCLILATFVLLIAAALTQRNNVSLNSQESR